jgi:hypothetical protein
VSSQSKSDPWVLYLYAIKSPATKEKYLIRLGWQICNNILPAFVTARCYFKDTERNFLTKNNTAPAGIKRAKRSSK